MPLIPVNYDQPLRLDNETKARLWLESFVTAIVETSTDKALIWQGWVNMVKTRKSRWWPVPGELCAEIEKVKPPKEALRGPKPRADGKHAKGCSDYVAANIKHIVSEWWLLNSGWVEDFIRETGADERRAKSIRGSIGNVIERAALYHAQKLYWGTENGPLDLDVKDYHYWRDRLNHNIKGMREQAARGWEPIKMGPVLSGILERLREKMKNPDPPEEEQPA